MHGGGEQLKVHKRPKHDTDDEKKVVEHALEVSPLADFAKARKSEDMNEGHGMCAKGHHVFWHDEQEAQC